MKGLKPLPFSGKLSAHVASNEEKAEPQSPLGSAPSLQCWACIENEDQTNMQHAKIGVQKGRVAPWWSGKRSIVVLGST